MMTRILTGLMILFFGTAQAHAEDPWGGTWFTCEFAKSRTPPHDSCAMFDDEGFRFSDGRFTYVRITESDETACRGEKVGQCFRRDRPAISISTTDRGSLDLGPDRIRVRYLLCTQLFYFKDTEHYREIWRYDGEITETP